jgi:flagellar hook assembly protein FlgD
MLRQQSYGELLDVSITKASLDIITTLANEQSPSFNFNVFIGQNYPNPFIHTTTIAYELYNSGYVSMSIQDISGKTILYRVLDYQVPGKYTITWDGLDNQQKSIHPGIYFYSIIVNGHKLTRSIILAK